MNKQGIGKITKTVLTDAVPKGIDTVEILIPVYNEEDILKHQLIPIFSLLPDRFSIFVVENGSTDKTVEILKELTREYPAFKYISLPQPNYGLAMKTALSEANGDILITEDLDVLDTDFWLRGLRILNDGEVDIVQGSKVLSGKDDKRPLIRKLATLTLTFLLRHVLGYKGTDTHGPKVLIRESIIDTLAKCEFELDLFPTELVIRAQRAGIRIREIPIHLSELRATPLPLFKRVPRALRDILRLRKLLSSKWGQSPF